MGEFVKWALLAAGAIALIALIIALPFMDFLNVGQLETQFAIIATYCGTAFTSARGLINIFLSSFGRRVLSGLLGYLMLKWVIKLGIKISAWVYHFIFK